MFLLWLPVLGKVLTWLADFWLPPPAPLTGLPAGVDGREAAAEAGLGVPRSPGVRLEAIWVTGAVLLLVALSCGLAPAPGVLGRSERGAVTDCFRGCFLVRSVAETGTGALFTEPVEVLAAGVEGLDVDFAGGEALAVFAAGADLLLALLSSFFFITGFFT